MSLDILQQKKQAIGSILNIKIMPVDKLNNSLTYNNEKTKVLNQLNESNFSNIYFTEDKSSDNGNQSFANVDLHNQSIECFVPLKNLDRIKTIHKYLHAKLMALVTYNTGEKILVGNKEEYLRMSYNESSGNSVEDTSGLNITLSGDFSAIPPFYDPQL